MGWFKNDPPPALPPVQPEGMVSKILNSVLGTKSDIARRNDAIAAAQQALKSGQQIHLKDKATNKIYKELMAHHGGKNLPTATASDGVTQYVDVPGTNGGTDHNTIVHGVIVSTWHTG